MTSPWPAFPTITFEDGIGSNADRIASDLENLADELRNFTEPLTTSVTQVIIPSIQQNFDSQGRPPWDRLSDATVERRGEMGPILDETGALKSVATSLGIWRITRDEAVIDDVPVSYAGYHQTGTSEMPARVFINYQEEDVERIELIFAEWTDEKIRSVGGF